MDAPRLSFAIPVYNGADTIGMVLDSLAAQTFTDWEAVVCDNASTDHTREVVADYMARDPRIRWEPNRENVGLIENFNRSLTLVRGEFVRWIGDDDTVEPGYAAACVAALDAHPDWAAVTTHQDFIHEDGSVSSAVYDEERLDADDPVRRYQRLFFFLTANFRYCDPCYAMFRREPMLRAAPLHHCFDMDRVFASRVILEGPIGHLRELLAHRCRPLYASNGTRFTKILSPRHWRRVAYSRWALPGVLMLWGLWRSGLSPRQKLACLPTLAGHVGNRAFHHGRVRALGLARAVGASVVKRWLRRLRPVAHP